LKLKSLTPILFEGSLIISLSSKWIDVFEKIPQFEVRFENGILSIISENTQNS